MRSFWINPVCLLSSHEHIVLKVSYCDKIVSVVCRASCVVFQHFYLSIFFSELFIGFWPNFTGMIPRCSPTKSVQIVPVGCISKSLGQTICFQNATFKKSILSETTRSYLVYNIIYRKFGPWNLGRMHTAWYVEFNFDICWPRFWPLGLLSCFQKYNHKIWTACVVKI